MYKKYTIHDIDALHWDFSTSFFFFSLIYSASGTIRSTLMQIKPDYNRNTAMDVCFVSLTSLLKRGVDCRYFYYYFFFSLRKLRCVITFLLFGFQNICIDKYLIMCSQYSSGS